MQADSAVGVAGDLLSPAVRFIYHRLDFLQTERGLGNQLSLLTDPGAMSHVHLDPVGAVVQLLSRGFSRLDWTVHDLCAFRHIELGSITFQWVTASCRNRPCNDEQPRSWNI